MSTSSLYKVYKTKVTKFAELRNGHGSAAPVWEYLEKTFLGGTRSRDYTGSALWKLACDDRVPEHFRIVHAFTFDYAVCPPSGIGRLIEASRKAYTELYESTHWGHEKVNHWNLIADELEKVKLDNRCIGIGIGCISVSDPWEERATEFQPFDCINYATLPPTNSTGG